MVKHRVRFLHFPLKQFGVWSLKTELHIVNIKPRKSCSVDYRLCRTCNNLFAVQKCFTNTRCKCCTKPPHSKIRLEDEQVFIQNSSYNRAGIKKRVLEQKLLPYICSICNNPPVWQSKPLVLILDHINGINNDNRLINLRFVCSNCDSQLPTYKSKNRQP